MDMIQEIKPQLKKTKQKKLINSILWTRPIVAPINEPRNQRAWATARARSKGKNKTKKLRSLMWSMIMS